MTNEQDPPSRRRHDEASLAEVRRRQSRPNPMRSLAYLRVDVEAGLVNISAAIALNNMNTPILTVGMKITHPNHGEGIVEKVSEGSADIRFGNVLRTIDPRLADISVPEPTVRIGEADIPLK